MRVIMPPLSIFYNSQLKVVWNSCMKCILLFNYEEKLLDGYVAKQPVKPQWTLLNSKSMTVIWYSVVVM